MEPVKEERASPILQDQNFVGPDPSTSAGGVAPETKEYRDQNGRTPTPPSTQIRTLTSKHSLHSTSDLVCNNYKSLIESTTSSLLNSTVEEGVPAATAVPCRSKNGIRDALSERAIRTHPDAKHAKEHLQFLHQEDISDAVTKILEDYDWSQIPLANSDRRKVHVKRPMNAFMVWAQEARKKLSGQHRQVHNAELSKSLGRIWRGMTEEQKKPFIERAEQLRKRHKQEYPDYKYQPRRRKENIKTVSGGSGGKSPSSHSSCVSVQDITAAQAFASMKGLGMHPLSPPHSPTSTHSTSRIHDGHPGPIQETVFVGECITTDSFDGIDRAEMNKYLLPDQSVAYVHTHGGIPPNPSTPCSTTGSHMTVTMGSVSPVLNSSGAPTGIVAVSATGPSVNAGPALSPGSSIQGTCSTTLPPLQSLSHPRLMPSTSGYVPGSASPYYSGMSSPQETAAVGATSVTGSPEISLAEGIGNSGSPEESAGGSPDSPVEYVELQPPRILKEEPLTSLGSHKSPVNHFLPQNICYSQHYPYNYPYPYPVWHG